MFTPNYYWLVFDKDQNNLTIKEVLIKNQLVLSIGSELIWVRYDFKMVALYDIYQTGLHPNENIYITSLTKNSSHNWNHRKWKLDQRTNLQSLVLNATSVIKPGTDIIAKSDASVLQDKKEILDYLDDDQDTNNDSLIRFSWSVNQLLQQMFNFIVNIKPTSSWGYLWDGKFDGMVALINNGSADIGITAAGFRIVRTEYIDYLSTQIWPSHFMFLLRNPNKSGSMRNVFFRPLSKSSWICVLTTLIFVFILMQFSSYLLKYFHLVRGDSWSGNFVTIVGAICQQGSSMVPEYLDYRIVFLHLYVWAMLIYQFYTSSIVSALLSMPPISIRNLADLAHSDLHIAFEDTLTSRDTINRYRSNPNLEMIYEKHIAPDEKTGFYSLNEGVKRMKEGLFAFYTDPTYIYNQIEDSFSDFEICELTEVYLQRKEFLSIPIQKNSPYKKLMTYGIRKAEMSGLIKREVSRWRSRKPICTLTSQEHKPVGLEETSSAFLLLFIGILFSLVIFVVELLYYRYRV